MKRFLTFSSFTLLFAVVFIWRHVRTNGETFLAMNCIARCHTQCAAEIGRSKFERLHSFLFRIIKHCTVPCMKYFNDSLCTDVQCWSECYDLGPAITSPPRTPSNVTAHYNKAHNLSLRWNSVDKTDLFLIEYISVQNKGTTGRVFTNMTEINMPLPLNFLCTTLNVTVAGATSRGGLSAPSPVITLDRVVPNVTLAMRSLTLENKQYHNAGFTANQTVRLLIEYDIHDWVLGSEDIKLEPVLFVRSCKKPLINPWPVPEFKRSLNIFEMELPSTLIDAECRLAAVIQQTKSIVCNDNYGFNPKMLQFVLKCDGIMNCNKTKPQPVYAAPLCGQTKNFKYRVVNESTINWDNPNASITVNVTFDSALRRVPRYYIARYGNAVEFDVIDEKSFLGVLLVDELGISSNCLQVGEDGNCKKYTPANNSILISNLKADHLYGVMICAVMDSRNLTLPSISKNESRSLQIRSERVEVHTTEFLAHTSSNLRQVLLIIFGGVLALVIFLALMGAFCVWRQRAVIQRRKLSLEVMRMENEKRYTDLPKRSNNIWELERRNLIIYDEKKLGSGAFGAVYLGRLIGVAKGSKDAQSALCVNLMRADNCDVAVKMLPEIADEMSKSEFLREIELMKTLGYHERLVNMLACVTNSEPYCLVVEFCADGDLLRFLKARCEYMLKLDEEGVDYFNSNCGVDFDADMIMSLRQLLQYTVQISYGLEYLSQKGFVHRDVAARNVLVHDKYYAKIGDFGLCRYIYASESQYKSNGGRLPVKWMSPEAIRDYEFTTKSDVWSFGVLMFEIITLGGTPYPGLAPNDMLDFLMSGRRLAKPDNCPDVFYEVMSICWAMRPDDRPEFATIRRRLAFQLEEIIDEYSYLKLDAQKDYYNVAKREEREQAGEDLSERGATHSTDQDNRE